MNLKDEIDSKVRINKLKLVLVKAMEQMVTGEDKKYTYAEVNTVLVDLLNHNLGEELKGEWSSDNQIK